VRALRFMNSLPRLQPLLGKLHFGIGEFGPRAMLARTLARLAVSVPSDFRELVDLGTGDSESRIEESLAEAAQEFGMRQLDASLSFAYERCVRRIAMSRHERTGAASSSCNAPTSVEFLAVGQAAATAPARARHAVTVSMAAPATNKMAIETMAVRELPLMRAVMPISRGPSTAANLPIML
jgi:hypothetical protein